MKLNEKGSVTMIVVVTIFFIVILLSSFLIYTSSRRRAQLEETEKISEAYDGDMEEIYFGLAAQNDSASAEASFFDTSYGRIEVVWLDLENNIIDEPLAPNTKGMTPIKWEGTTEVETTEDDEDWYEYVAGIGTDDNLRSKWANVKDENGSYFVWIPRYAYRITYYPDETSTKVSGYCDGRGIVDSNGKMQYPLDEGIKTVEKDGVSYIVHPAFMDDKIDQYTHGGWDIDLPGIWVGKYEASGTAASLKIVPNKSAYGQNINVEYNSAYKYNRSRESHLIKNSEWGAVVYLTHSQYGRNGNEIDINNSKSYITGNGGGSPNAAGESGIINAYDTEKGQKASSTGNIYGIYDLSGGGTERTACFNSMSNELDNGNEFAGFEKNSTKYCTAYENKDNTSFGNQIFTVGKIGDATKEIYIIKNYYGWFNDYSYFLTLNAPFWDRGGSYYDGMVAGIFSAQNNEGEYNGNYSIRITLPGD